MRSQPSRSDDHGGYHDREHRTSLGSTRSWLLRRQTALAGRKGYVTNLKACPDGTPVTAEFVIGAYHQPFQIEAHLTIVFAPLAVIRWTEDRTGWPVRKFVRTARRYCTIEI